MAVRVGRQYACDASQGIVRKQLCLYSVPPDVRRLPLTSTPSSLSPGLPLHPSPLSCLSFHLPLQTCFFSFLTSYSVTSLAVTLVTHCHSCQSLSLVSLTFTHVTHRHSCHPPSLMSPTVTCSFPSLSRPLPLPSTTEPHVTTVH